MYPVILAKAEMCLGAAEAYGIQECCSPFRCHCLTLSFKCVGLFQHIVVQESTTTAGLFSFLLRRPYHGKWSKRPKNSTIRKLLQTSIYPHLLQPRVRRCVAAGGIGIERAIAGVANLTSSTPTTIAIATDITITSPQPPRHFATHLPPTSSSTYYNLL